MANYGSNTVSFISVLVVSVSPGSATLDVGQSQTFTATPSGGSGTYSSSTGYQWYVDGSPQSGQTASTFSFAPAAGSYSITATVTDSSSVTSAPSNAAAVTVNAAPTVTIAPVGPVALDVGQSQTFTASASGGTGTLSYQWYLGSSPVGSDSDIYIFSGSAGSYSVTCMVTDSASPPVTSPASNAVSVTVYSALVAPTVTATPTTVDQGQTSALTSTTVSTGSSGYIYQWFEKAPGGSYVTVGTSSASFSFVTSGSTAAGSWSFILKVTDSAGAAVNSTAASVSVNVAPTVSIAPTGSLALTVGQVQAFTATPSGGSGAISYQWYLDGAAVGSNSAGYSYTAAGTSHSVTCTVTDSASTPVTSPASNAVTITVNPTATPSPTPPTQTSSPTSQPNTTPTPTPAQHTASPAPTPTATPTSTPPVPEFTSIAIALVTLMAASTAILFFHKKRLGTVESKTGNPNEN